MISLDVLTVTSGKLVESLRSIKNLLCGSEVNNEKSPRSIIAKVVIPADFLPSAKVVVKKQDSSFKN